MARHRYLVAYDISDDRRLRQVHTAVKGYGHALQYSLFVCDLDAMELTGLKLEVGALIKHDIDRVAVIRLSHADDRCFQFLGVRPVLPTWGPTIV